MVLYGKKQVTIQRPRPIPEDLSTQIYVIPQTREWFVEYDDYLARMDFYKRRKFVCEITGSSGLTYFEAHASEQKEYAETDANFPEALREHILKFLLFNTITRLDLLVDKIYLLFKNEYFPGEEVYVKKIFTTTSETKKGIPAIAQPDNPNVHSYISTVKQRGVIREKVQYSNSSDTKYFVSIIDKNSQVSATNQQISRDRNHFTKWLIKVFIKMTVTRSYMPGSSWVVKKKYAKKYRILREFPEEFKQYEASTPTGSVIYDDDYEILGITNPADQGQKKSRGKYKYRGSNGLTYNGHGVLDSTQLEGCFPFKANPKHELRLKFPTHHLPATIQKEILENNFLTMSSFQPSKRTLVEDLTLQFDLQTARPSPLLLFLPDNALELHKSIADKLEEELSALNEEIKTEEAQEQKVDTERRKLQSRIAALRKASLGRTQEALECWMFLNIYHSVLKLDTFTFDDFVYAMSWNAKQLESFGRCELLDEIWCAVLSAIVSNQMPSSKVVVDSDKIDGLQVILPPKLAQLSRSNGKVDDDMQSHDKGSDSDSEQKNSKLETDNFEDESSADEFKARQIPPKSENGKPEEEGNGAADEQEEKSDKQMNLSHKAYLVMKYRGIPWYERLRKRNFKDGNWQTIVLGVLSMVEYVPEFYNTIQEAYNTFAPNTGQQATPATVLNQFYHCVSLELRLEILQILVSLVVTGPLVRNYIEECLESTTSYRREKLDIYKDLKAAIEHANKIHSDIYERLLDGANNVTDPALWSLFTRKKHRLKLSGYEMTEYEKDLLSKDSSFQEVWDQREAAIVKIKELKVEKKRAEMQISQIDCQRVTLLGKDRHYNRYWWFENNGLPNLHSSSAQEDDDEQQDSESEDDFDDKDDSQAETYLMGRLWIQGPYAMDVNAHMNLTPEAARKIAVHFDEEVEAMQKTKQEFGGTLPNKQEPEHLDLEDGGAPLKVMDFHSLPKCTVLEAKKLGSTFGKDSILLDSSELVDRLGAVSGGTKPQDIGLLRRKFIEESPVPLLTGDQWMYFDRTEDLEQLIEWLNPWGKRESLLRKELLRVKEGAMSSIIARRQALWLDRVPKEDIDIEAEIEAVEARIQQKSSTDAGTDAAIVKEEVTKETGMKRGRRNGEAPNKRQRTAEETLKAGNLTDLSGLLTELQEKRKEMRRKNHLSRVLEWVNSRARDECNKSLYEGGDKSKEKQKKKKDRVQSIARPVIRHSIVRL